MNKKAFVALLNHAGNMTLQIEDVSINTENNQVILVTAAGHIVGTVLTKSHGNMTSEDISDNVFIAAGRVFTDSTSQDDFILLKDAALKTLAGEISYSYLYVFTDDIIAVSICNSRQI